MSKLKVLIPLDNTEKTRESIKWLKKLYSPEDVEVTLINIKQTFYKGYSVPSDVDDDISLKSLEAGEKELAGYSFNSISAYGYAPEAIVDVAAEGKYDLIIMAKSGHKGLARIVGSVTHKVIRNTDIPVMVVPE